jgi:hypothetical protein
MAQADFQDPSADFALKEEVLVEKRKYGDNERNSTASVRRAIILKKERAFALVEFTEKDTSLRSDKQKIPYTRLKKVPKPPVQAPKAPAPVNGNATSEALRAVPQAFANVKLVPPSQPEQKLVQLPKKQPEQQRLPTSPLMAESSAPPAPIASTSNSGVYPQGYISIEPTTSASEAKQSLPPPIEPPTPPALTPKQEARSLGVGDDVMVHEILGTNARFSKPRKARIVERLSSGVRVVFFDDKSEKAVQWNRIERAVDELTPAYSQDQPGIRPPPRQPETVLIATKPEPTLEPTPKPISDLTAWLEMGAQLLDQLVRKQTALRDEAKQHASEAQRLVVLANDKTREAAAMQTQIDQFAPQIHAFSTDMLKKL